MKKKIKINDNEAESGDFLTSSGYRQREQTLRTPSLLWPPNQELSICYHVPRIARQRRKSRTESRRNDETQTASQANDCSNSQQVTQGSQEEHMLGLRGTR